MVLMLFEYLQGRSHGRSIALMGEPLNPQATKRFPENSHKLGELGK
jgi:hypothetical protein